MAEPEGDGHRDRGGMRTSFGSSRCALCDDALRQAGPSTAAELAGHAKPHERSTREWLEQQAVAGILDVDDVEASPDARRYRLPAGHAEVLLERDSLAYLGGLAQIIAGIFVHLPDLVDALHADG